MSYLPALSFMMSSEFFAMNSRVEEAIRISQILWFGE
jgi:hypothetical protein